MSAKVIPITFECEPLALTTQQAAKALGVSRKTVWKLKSLGKIKATSYGTIPVAELHRHLRQEVA